MTAYQRIYILQVTEKALKDKFGPHSQPQKPALTDALAQDQTSVSIHFSQENLPRSLDSESGPR